MPRSDKCTNLERPHRPHRAGVVLAAAALLGAPLSATSASSVAVASPSAGHAVASRPGPALSVPNSELRAALQCPKAEGSGKPVLLVHGTSATPDIAWANGLQPLLIRAGYRVCTVALPAGASGPADVAAEYVTYSIRTMAARFHSPVSVVGHSQGGMLPRWSITWWPDIRSLVDDIIGLAPSNHGSPTVEQLCAVACPAAYWQQKPSSQFLSALNRVDETPGRVDYSVIYSQTDTTVPPPSPVLKADRSDSNIALQYVCSERQVSHTQILYDAVAVAAVFDALTHDGPARLARISRAICEHKYAEGINEVDAEGQQQLGTAYAVLNFAAGPNLTAEPGLPRYASRTVPQPRAGLIIGRHTDHKERTLLRAIGTWGTQRWPLPLAYLLIDGKRFPTDTSGRAFLRIRRDRPAVQIRLVAQGLEPIDVRVVL